MSVKAATGKAAVSHLISCNTATSGFTSVNQPVTLGRRALTELTFQVAMRMDLRLSRSDGERRTAAARGGGVGVFDLKRRSHQVFDIIQRRAVQRAVQRVDAPGAPPTTDQSQPGGQQTVLSGIDVARNPPTTPGQPGTPVEAATQASIDDPLKHPYYESTFKRRVVALFASGKVAAPAQPPEAIAQDIWLKVCSAVKASMPAMDDPTTYSNWARKWVDMKTPGFESAIAQFANVASSLAGYASTQFANARSFGFWSKPEGRELGESICDVTLETSGVGALFDGLPSLNGNGAGWDPQIWGALSRGYAEAVAGAVSVGGKRVHVCVGAGAPPDNIWGIVESKALAKGLESARLALEDVVTYHGAAATTKNDRKLDRARKSGSGAFPGCVYSGDSRADAATAADTHYAGLP